MNLEGLKHWYDTLIKDDNDLHASIFIEDKNTGELFDIIGFSDYSFEARGYALYIRKRLAKEEPKEHTVTIETRDVVSKSGFWGSVKKNQKYLVCINGQKIASFTDQCEALLLKDRILEAFKWQS